MNIDPIQEAPIPHEDIDPVLNKTDDLTNKDVTLDNIKNIVQDLRTKTTKNLTTKTPNLLS